MTKPVSTFNAEALQALWHELPLDIPAEIPSYSGLMDQEIGRSQAFIDQFARLNPIEKQPKRPTAKYKDVSPSRWPENSRPVTQSRLLRAGNTALRLSTKLSFSFRPAFDDGLEKGDDEWNHHRTDTLSLGFPLLSVPGKASLILRQADTWFNYQGRTAPDHTKGSMYGRTPYALWKLHMLGIPGLEGPAFSSDDIYTSSDSKHMSAIFNRHHGITAEGHFSEETRSNSVDIGIAILKAASPEQFKRA